MLPQSARDSPKNCIAEINRCINGYGFAGINLKPDPSGGHWLDPPLSDRYWYPVYEKMVEYDIPAMIHVSASCNPTHHTTGSHYLNGDTAGFNQLMTSSVFKDFPAISSSFRMAAVPCRIIGAATAVCNGCAPCKAKYLRQSRPFRLPRHKRDLPLAELRPRHPLSTPDRASQIRNVQRSGLQISASRSRQPLKEHRDSHKQTVGA
jgi:hypothetical protein